MHREAPAKSDIRLYLRVLGRHKLIMAFSFVVIFSLSILGIFLAKPVYQAEVKILIKTPEGGGLVNSDIDLIDRSIGPIRTRILSSSYLEKVVERLNLVKRLRDKVAVGEYIEASDQMLKRLVINDFQRRSIMVLSRGDYVFIIRAYNSDPSLTMKIANTTAQVFIEENRRDERAGLNVLFAFISEQLEKYKNRLLYAEEQLADYKTKEMIPDELSRKSKNIASYEAKKVKYEIDLKTNSLELENLQKISQDSDSYILEYYRNNPQAYNTPQISALEISRHEYQQQLDDLLMNYTSSYPTVIETKKKLRGQQIKLIEVVKAVIQKKIENYQKDFDLTRMYIKDFDEKIKAYNESIKNLPAQEIKYLRLLREKKMNENLYQLFIKKVEESEITRASDQKQIRDPYKIIEPALVPLRPVKPNKRKMLILGAALGIAAGLAWVFILEFFNTSIKDANDISKIFDFPNLGIIPLIDLGQGKKQDIESFFNKESGYLTEFIRFFKNIDVISSPQVLLFTSSVKGEGKSLLISCLALTAARMQKERVLLIDGDMRNRSLHLLFKESNDLGLSDVLTDIAELDIAIKETKFPQLDIITAGNQVKMPGEIIELPAYTQLLGELRKKYRYIFIDSPPVIPVNDAISFSCNNNVDGVVYVIMAGKTPLEIIHRGIKILEQANIKIIGSAINNRNDILATAGYGYDYAYPYK